MAISEMKKLTLLAEVEYLEDVMLTLQSDQAVEIIPTTSDIHRELLSQYQEENGDETKTDDETDDLELFEVLSYDSEINQLSHVLDDLEDSIEFLEELLPSPGFLEKLRQEKETFSLYELEEYMEDVEVSALIEQANRLKKRIDELNDEKERLEEEREFLKRWRSLDFNPKETKDFKLTEVIVGAVHSERNDEMREALSHFHEIYLEEIHYTEEETIYLVIVSAADAHDVEQTLIRHRFERLNYKYDQLPEDELKRNKTELNEIKERMKQYEKEPDKGKQLLKDLKLAEEYIFSLRERKKASEEILRSEYLFIVSGWIEESKLDNQIQAIEKRIGEAKIFTFVDDVKESEIDSVPTVYKNKPSTSAFENIVSMYSVPKYDEMDPTPYVQPFSILFFGMMTADAGYGLLGLIACFLALKFLNLSTSMQKNIRFFGQLMIGTTLAGLFFGSFFGFELPFGVMSLNDQLLEVMVLSIGIGIVHLLLGLFLNTVINNRRKDYAESYISGYSWILVLLSVVAIALNMYFGGPEVVTNGSIVVILASLAGIVLVSTFSNENKAAGLGEGLFGLFDVTSYIGDVISYTRLTALGVASANIAMAFNLIIGLLPVWARFTIGILIFIGLHLFNMFIGMISGYVHTLRLNYVEFFGKFYNGGGREFQAIPTLQKHIHIRNNVTQ